MIASSVQLVGKEEDDNGSISKNDGEFDQKVRVVGDKLANQLLKDHCGDRSRRLLAPYMVAPNRS